MSNADLITKDCCSEVEGAFEHCGVNITKQPFEMKKIQIMYI